jgi:hypothetical protein
MQVKGQFHAPASFLRGREGAASTHWVMGGGGGERGRTHYRNVSGYRDVVIEKVNPTRWVVPQVSIFIVTRRRQKYLGFTEKL